MAKQAKVASRNKTIEAVKNSMALGTVIGPNGRSVYGPSSSGMTWEQAQNLSRQNPGWTAKKVEDEEEPSS